MYKPSTISGLRRMMQEYDIKAKKRWGQNFLVDGNILNKIAAYASSDQKGYVVEIGPGLGALTELLALSHQGVLAVDIDNSLEPALKQALLPYNNVQLIFRDVLGISIEEELLKAFGLRSLPDYTVCANIPYNITTPIIFKLLQECPHMKSAVLMMQKEVAQRIMALPGGKDYGLLTLTVGYHARTKYLMNVSPFCFYPRPEVESAVIEIIPGAGKSVQVKEEKQFINLLRYSFQRRRKTILNIVADFFGCDKAQARKLLEKADISPARRPETLALEEFAHLFNTFEANIFCWDPDNRELL